MVHCLHIIGTLILLGYTAHFTIACKTSSDSDTVYMSRCMTISMYCLYVGFDYTYIDINAMAQGIKSVLASQVWFQAITGARTYGTSMCSTSILILDND